MLNFHARKKIKLVMLGFGIFLSCLVMAVGIYAVTNQQNSQFNMGIFYQPEYLVKVEIGVDKNSDGSVANNEFIEIYNSTAPVDNGFYVDGISGDTIKLNGKNIAPVNGWLIIRYTNLDTKQIKAIVRCAGASVDSGYLQEDESLDMPIETGTANLGALLINIKFEVYIPAYNVFDYAAGTGPIYDNNNAANRYEHYIEMGEYPQTYYGTTLPKAESEYTITPDYYTNMDSNKVEIKSALYKDKTSGTKFAKQGANFYNVEPVKWIVMGVTDGVLNGTSVLFTANNKTAGLWQYNSATNTFQYRTNTANAWTTATEVLVLSEYGLMRGQFNPSTNNNRFSQCTINGTLNTTLYNSLFTANQKTKIKAKTMAITTRNGALNSGEDAGVAYNMFLLGARRNWNGGWGLHGTDSYNISTCFAPENNSSNQGNLVLKETSYSGSSTATSPDGYGAYTWWLRSGTDSYYSSFAMYVNTYASVGTGADVSSSYALRPAFVLNLA